MIKSITTRLFLAALLCSNLVEAQTLKGSTASIDKQYRIALDYGYTFVNSSRSVADYVNKRQLARVSPDRHLELHDVSYPYAVPGTKQFLTRLSQQYHRTCGEKLTVTSLLRPRDRQPANSVAQSVHPAGMAVDLRVPSTRKCRAWLESTLLSLEKQHIVDVTRERNPPHYHVAVFARNYGTGVDSLSASSRAYVVRRGDTLSGIAASNGISVAQLRTANGLQGSLINTGQKLRIPTAAGLMNAAAEEGIAVIEINHRVNRGDTLWRIANRYGTSVEQLRQTNRKASDFLQVGQVLKIIKNFPG